MKLLGARWDIRDVANGRSVVYQNFVHDKRFDCGVERQETPLGLILEFIAFEGDPGDLVFYNGSFYTQLHAQVPTCS